MKTIKIELAIIMLLLFISCDLLFEDNRKVKTFNDFTYELSDDVSPVMVTFRANGDWNWTRWTIGNQWMANEINNTTAEVLLREPGLHQVSFEGWKDYKYIGNGTIQIPPPATKIQIQGVMSVFLAERLFFEDKAYAMELAYYDSEKYEYKESSIDFSGISLKDTALMSESIQFDVEEFHNNEGNFVITISIIDKEKEYPDKVRFRGMFHLNNAYSYHRTIFDGKIQLNNFNDETESVFLIVDWTP